MKPFRLFLIICCTIPVFSQPYGLSEYLSEKGFYNRWPASAPSSNIESMELNELGNEAYAHGDYNKAADYFESAAELDPGNAVAHYYLACALSQYYGRMSADDLIHTRYESRERLNAHIVTYLREAAQIDNHWFLKMLIDPALDSVRGGGFGYHYYQPSPGGVAPDYEYHYNIDGRVSYSLSQAAAPIGGPDEMDSEEWRTISEPSEFWSSGAVNGWYTRIGMHLFLFIPGFGDYYSDFLPFLEIPPEEVAEYDYSYIFPLALDEAGNVIAVPH